MKDFKIQTTVHVCTLDELDASDRELVSMARNSTSSSYAPYSHFSVGAAVRLDNGETVCGSNQENAAYPSGLCAERVALFYASARYPGCKILALAIAARSSEGFTGAPVTPCGSCRQVFAELKARYGAPVRLLMCGAEEVWVVEDACALLPLSFDESSL